MKIKEVENQVGMTRANIRYYEQEGLLNPTSRNENNYREYSEEDVKQLQRIKILRLLGFGNRKAINSVIFWGIGLILFISFFAIHYTANVLAHVIAFHVSAVLLAPFAFGIAYIYREMLTLGKPLASIEIFEVAGLGIMLLGYVVISYVLSEKWDKMFTKVKYCKRH